MPHIHYEGSYGNRLPAICGLAFGIGILALATVYACIGEAWLRGDGHYERIKNPIKFWLAVAFYYGLGAVLILSVYH